MRMGLPLRSRLHLERKIDSLRHAMEDFRRRLMNTRATKTADVPQTDAYYCEVPNDPCAIVMFGASGDLARRKLLPALYDLAVHACLRRGFACSDLRGRR